MSFQDLKRFLSDEMRMSHIYQPVMIAALIRHGGRMSTSAIAKELLSHDESQLEYYQRVIRGMVGQVLQRRGVVKREGAVYQFLGYDTLDDSQAKELLSVCRDTLLRMSRSIVPSGNVQALPRALAVAAESISSASVSTTP